MTYKDWIEKHRLHATLEREITQGVRRSYKVPDLQPFGTTYSAVEVWIDGEKPGQLIIKLVRSGISILADDAWDHELEFLTKVRRVVRRWTDGEIEELPKEIE
jgi:hypothetical protein